MIKEAEVWKPVVGYEGLDRIIWFMGYENSFGSVSSVGGELREDTQKLLESEYQEYINMK